MVPATLCPRFFREVEIQTSKAPQDGLAVVGSSGGDTEEWSLWSSAVVLVVIVVLVAHVSLEACVWVCVHACVFVVCTCVCVWLLFVRLWEGVFLSSGDGECSLCLVSLSIWV